MTSLDELTVPAPEPGPADWNDEGVVKLHGFYACDNVRRDLAYAYKAAWCKEHWSQGLLFEEANRGGWDYATPYVHVPQIRALIAPLADYLQATLGEPAGMHLNLTGWVTTERDWHQDSYLNPAHVGDSYVAAWIALDDIHPFSGPFQYVPGSHRWRQVTQEKIGHHLDLADPAWPKQSEDILSPLFEDEITRNNAHVETWVPKFGDVLLWHGRLLHRGSKAITPGMIRPGIIVHFSGIQHREDMPPAVRDEFGGWVFPLNGYQPVR